MIATLKGKIINKSTNEVVIDCGGVGYLVFISLYTKDKLPPQNEEVYLYTIMILRDDAIQLYGFIDNDEREAFRQLINIPGIGPKIALGILSSVDVDTLFEYISTNNLQALQKLPGIGKKTAERIVVELRDKIKKIRKTEVDTDYYPQKLIREEAILALISLGYSKQVAEKAINNAIEKIGNTTYTTEDLIRLSLKLAIK